MAELLKLDAPAYIVIHFAVTSGDASSSALRITADAVHENDECLELLKDGELMGRFFLSHIAGWWADK